MNEYAMYNGNVYKLGWNIFTKKKCIVTRFKEKTDGTFHEYLDRLDRYVRDVERSEIPETVRLLTISFYITYNDSGKADGARNWNVNEEATYRLPVQIENDVVSISFYGKDKDKDYKDIDIEGWTALQDEPGGFSLKGWYAKEVNIHDCEKLVMKFNYPDESEEVVLEPEEFKAAMIKYRLSNI